MEKIKLSKLVPIAALASLPIVATANLSESEIQTSSSRAAARRMNAVLADINFKADTKPLSENDFLLKNYSAVAISTDLETDDVLALSILFDEANRIYQESPGSKYPIDLLIVGEGNAAIKKMRMEKLINEYFNIPPGVVIRVVEGSSTKDNDFVYDGLELFDPEVLEGIPYPEENQAAAILESWAIQAANPLIIQLKPAPELLYMDADAAAKTSLLFYGSFNLRKTIQDPSVKSDFAFAAFPSIAEQLNGLMNCLSGRFEKIAILESFGVLGEQSKVWNKSQYFKKIGELVRDAKDPFLVMFRNLSENWNANIQGKFISDCRSVTKAIMDNNKNLQTLLEDIYLDLCLLDEAWEQERFNSLFQKASERSQEIMAHSQDARLNWKGLMRKLNVVDIIGEGVQFTLSDVLVAMATLGGTDLFHGAPVRVAYNLEGFVVPESDPKSNVIYYGPSDHNQVANWIEQYLESK